MIISFEGGIGVGKSTLIDGLWGRLSATPHLEELDGDFLKLLGDYNKDGSKAIHLQNHILAMRTRLINEIKNMDQERIHLLERSSISDIIFAHVMYEQDSLSYDDFWDFVSRADEELEVAHPDLVVYLRCYPEVSFNRAISRSRPEESDNDLEYFEMLHEQHETLIPEYCINLDIPYITFNCSDDYPDADLISREILHALRRTD